MKFKNNKSIFTFVIIAALFGLGYLAYQNNWSLNASVITSNYQEMGSSTRYSIGSTIDLASITDNFNVQMKSQGYQLVNPSKYASLKPIIKEIEIYTFATGETHVEIAFTDGTGIDHIYDASQAGDYNSNLMLRIDSVINCQNTAPISSLVSHYEKCSNVQISTYINRAKEVSVLNTDADCTAGETTTRTCCDNSIMTTNNCQNGRWISTGQSCSKITCGDSQSCTTGQTKQSTCAGGSNITVANCISSKWNYNNATCPVIIPSSCTEGQSRQALCSNGKTTTIERCVSGNWVMANATDCTGAVEDTQDTLIMYIGIIVFMIISAIIIYVVFGKKR
jgi:hypothetical protein